MCAAIEWATLNKTHRKGFSKEVCRFRVMDKQQYDFHGYVAEFTKEMIMEFQGYDSGSFLLELSTREFSANASFFSFNSVEELKSFRDLLDGKSVNKEIDDIFKN